MSREMLMLADALAREKNVSQEVVFEALEQALASATKKRFKEESDVRVSIDHATGDYESFRRWQVVTEADLESEGYQILLIDAQDKIPDIEIGDYIEEPLENIEFGRIGAQAAKQVILQKIRDAEREQIISDFLARKEHLVNGVVKHRSRQRHHRIRPRRRLSAPRPDDPARKPARRRPRACLPAAHRSGGPRSAGRAVAHRIRVHHEAVRAGSA